MISYPTLRQQAADAARAAADGYWATSRGPDDVDQSRPVWNEPDESLAIADGVLGLPEIKRALRLLAAVVGCKVDQRWDDDGRGYVAGVINPDGVLVKDVSTLLTHLHYYLEGVDGYEELRALRRARAVGGCQPTPTEPAGRSTLAAGGGPVFPWSDDTPSEPQGSTQDG